MKIGETRREGVYETVRFKEGAEHLVRLTDTGRNAEDRTALTAAFGNLLREAKVPALFLRRMSTRTIFCRRAEVRLPVDIRIQAVKPDYSGLLPQLAIGVNPPTPDEDMAKELKLLAWSTFKLLARTLEGFQLDGVPHELVLGKVDFSFGYAGELVMTNLFNLDTMEVVERDSAGGYRVFQDSAALASHIDGIRTSDDKCAA